MIIQYYLFSSRGSHNEDGYNESQERKTPTGI